MIWHVFFLGRDITAALKRHPNATISRLLLREFGVRRGTSFSPPTKVDRLWRAGASAVTAAICFGMMDGATYLSDHWPSFSVASYVFTGLAVFGYMFGIIAAAATLLELGRVPFAPSERWVKLRRE